jgi:hypothetical protein
MNLFHSFHMMKENLIIQYYFEKQFQPSLSTFEVNRSFRSLTSKVKQ